MFSDKSQGKSVKSQCVLFGFISNLQYQAKRLEMQNICKIKPTLKFNANWQTETSAFNRVPETNSEILMHK